MDMKGLSSQSSLNDNAKNEWNIADILQSSTDFIDRHLQLFQVSLPNPSSNSNPVSQSHTGFHDKPIESSTHELAKLSSLFSAFRKCLKLQNWYHNVLCCV